MTADHATMHIARATLALVAAASLAGCSTGPAKAPPSQEAAEARTQTKAAPAIMELLERDVALPRARPVLADDAKLELTIPTTELGQILRETGQQGYNAYFGLADNLGVNCYISDEEIDDATVIARSREISEETSEAHVGPVLSSRLSGVSAYHIDGLPALSATWLITVETADGPRIAQHKALASNAAGRGVICYHVLEVGYVQAFVDLTSAVVREVVKKYPHPEYEAPDFVEIFSTKLQGQVVGYMANEYLYYANGSTLSRSRTAMLAAAAPGMETASDSVNAELSDHDGFITLRGDTSSQGGEITSNLSLTPAQEGGGWTVAGVHQGKEFSAELEPGPIWGSHRTATALRDLLKREGVGGVLEHRQWTSSAPDTVLTALTTVLGKNGDGSYKVRTEFGPLSIEGDVEPSGVSLNGVMKMGPLNMQFDRIHTHGSL